MVSGWWDRQVRVMIGSSRAILLQSHQHGREVRSLRRAARHRAKHGFSDHVLSPISDEGLRGEGLSALATLHGMGDNGGQNRAYNEGILSMGNRKCVDRLSVLDGAVVAVGWSEAPDDPIVVAGHSEPAQVCVRFRRPDLVDTFGERAASWGFRISAALSDSHDNTDIVVRFADGERLRAETPEPSNTSEALLETFISSVAAKPNSSLIEIGSRARSGHTYRSMFPSARYLGIDVSPGPNVDVVADAHTLSRSVTGQFDFAFSISVFEHLIMPWVAAYELNRVLKTGGEAYIQSHAAWPLHDEPWDFFRFSREAWTGVFNRFTGFEIVETAYGLPANIVPIRADNGALQGLDRERTYLLSACLVRKIGEPAVDWSADPSEIYNLSYSH